MSSALTEEVRWVPGNTVENQAVGMSHTLSVEDVGMCSMVSPRQRKTGGTSVSYAPTEEVGVGPGTTVVSQAVGTSLPLPSLAVEDESFDKNHPQLDSPVGGVPAPFHELIMS